MEVLENTGAQRFDFGAVVKATGTSARFLHMMCEQEKPVPKKMPMVAVATSPAETR